MSEYEVKKIDKGEQVEKRSFSLDDQFEVGQHYDRNEKITEEEFTSSIIPAPRED